MTASTVTRLVPLSERPLHERVAAVVRAEMARYRVSQTSLARHLGVAQQNVSRKCSGRTPFALDELDVIAPLIGMRLVDIIRAAEGQREPGGDIADQECAIRDSNPEPAG